MTATVHPPIDAPFGSWKMDRIFSELGPSRLIHSVGQGTVAVSQEKYAIKILHRRDPSHELRMMLLAGPDCSIQPLGRVFDDSKQKLIGFIMQYEQAIAPGFVVGEDFQRPDFSKEKKREIISKIRELIERLQAKGIIHGDVKPSNFLLLSDGEVRFCDWALASVKGENFIPYAVSVHYSSPRRCQVSCESLSMQEDLYGTGVSIWEIWVGETPFEDIDDEEEDLEDMIAAGLRPDLRRVDDPTIAALITSYLDAGSRYLGTNHIELGRARKLTKPNIPYTYPICI